jgi:hypothetical protein
MKEAEPNNMTLTIPMCNCSRLQPSGIMQMFFLKQFLLNLPNLSNKSLWYVLDTLLWLDSTWPGSSFLFPLSIFEFFG